MKKINYLKTSIYLQIFILTLSFFFMDRNFGNLANLNGKFAIWTFWLIAITGILQRFKVKGFLQTIQLKLMKNRRYLGIIMFIFSLTHYIWVKGFEIIQYGFPEIIPIFQIFGMISLILLLPLFLTSNNFSIKKLGKFWKTLHYLVYPIMLLLIFHTGLQGADFQILGLYFGLENFIQYVIPSSIILILQIISYIYSKN